LQVYFQLHSSRTLKAILAKIPFDTGINPSVLEHLRSQVQKMKRADLHCTLLFDEMSLSSEFHYEQVKQYTGSLQSMATVKYLRNGFLEILKIWYGVKSI
jgi:hypothetical protein